MYDGDFSGGDWAVMVVMMFVMLAVLLAAVWLIARPRIGVGSKANRDPALDELRSRYARGEIDHGEFERRKSQLG